MSASRSTPERYAEPIDGWRVWRLGRTRRGSWALLPMFRDVPWEPGTAVEAVCTSRPGEHASPDAGCACGLYAMKAPDDLGSIDRIPGVIGTVSLWGRVVEHADGFRAQFAYPDRLRLACKPCLLGGTEPLPECEVVFLSASEGWVAACAQHRPRGQGIVAHPATSVQANLLGRYGVDPLPAELPVEGRPTQPAGTPGLRLALTKRSRWRAAVKAAVAVLLVTAVVVGLREAGRIAPPGVPPLSSPSAATP